MKQLVGYDWPEGRCKQIAYVGQDRHIHEFCVGVGGKWEHTNLMSLTGAPRAGSRFIVGYAYPEGGTKQVAYLDQDAHIHELWVSAGGQWQHTDLTLITGAPPAVRVSTGYSWSEGRSKQIVFIGDDSHIHELYFELGQPWRHVDLTAITNAPLPASNFMVGYGSSVVRCKQVTYVGHDGHIHELYMEVGKPWRHVDLTSITHAPRAVDVTIGYEWPEARCKQVAFISEDGHIHELCMVAGKSWTHADLTSLTNAPQAMNVMTGYAWPQGHSKQVAYLGQDGRIHELFVEAGKVWTHVDLMSLTNAPVTSITCIDGYVWLAGESKQVTYVGNDGEVRELWMALGSNWKYTNLSEIVSALPVRF
jgi:hypothetical protein